ncbi:decarboxylase [Klebsiella pneumoniae]|uniref:AMP nucleosidase n=1 Tax=Klebsiella pneumoniae TaxID=573 RepID=A0A378A9N3_KLEPN|nr:decarboxylase [Klebsiella pneumoniae]
MKGAAVGHAQQRYKDSRFIGMTEPSIIAAEPPNPLVNELIIMPDIEKRLEAFVRIAHGIIIFPGGVGTAEELLYLLGILMHPDNKAQVLPLILTGPKESADYFRVLDEFITHTLGESARRHYRIIIDDPAEVARQMKKAMPLVKESRRETDDAYSFNWSIRISPDLQMPFDPTTRTWPTSNSPRISRWKCWPPTCVVPSPGLSRGTSKRWASRPLSSTVLTNCTAIRR